MKLNISHPSNGSQKLIEIEDERKLRVFMDKRVCDGPKSSSRLVSVLEPAMAANPGRLHSSGSPTDETFGLIDGR